MRSFLWIFATLGACGSSHPATTDGSVDSPAVSDAPACQPQGAIGSFYRRPPNPRLLAGHAHSDGNVEIAISDPDLYWDDAAQLWQLYYHGPRATTFTGTNHPVIQHASSPDFAAWTIDDAPSLTASMDPTAWDHTHTETPTVVVNPDASPDRRYVLLYSGASGTQPGYTFANYAIGAAFSADGMTFTRVPASESPHGKDGLVLTGLDAYPGAGGAIVADPEVAYVGGQFHLWFSSFACMGTNCGTVADYGIAHATSPDAIHWTVDQAPVRSLLRASAMPTTGGSQPSVIYDAPHCRWEMWLHSDTAGETDPQPIVFNNMAGVWHATSLDGMFWTINYTGARDLAWSQTSSGEHLGLLTGADVAIKGTARYMAYVGFDNQNVPNGFVLPDRSTQGYEPGVMALDLATRDAP